MFWVMCQVLLIQKIITAMYGALTLCQTSCKYDLIISFNSYKNTKGYKVHFDKGGN